MEPPLCFRFQSLRSLYLSTKYFIFLLHFSTFRLWLYFAFNSSTIFDQYFRASLLSSLSWYNTHKFTKYRSSSGSNESYFAACFFGPFSALVFPFPRILSLAALGCTRQTCTRLTRVDVRMYKMSRAWSRRCSRNVNVDLGTIIVI